MDHNWSIKNLIREIVLSSTYRQSSAIPSIPAPSNPGEGKRGGTQDSALRTQDSLTIDATNDLFWHMNRRRLTIEQWRDTVLYVAGELEESADTKSMELSDPKNLHRTVYARISRKQLNDLLAQFDYPDANVHAERRAVTTTPMQKLFVLNSPFMLERSKSLAARLTADPKESDQSRIDRAYKLILGRPPDADEIKLALAFLAKPATGEMTRWEQYAQVLLASNELLYVD